MSSEIGSRCCPLRHRVFKRRSIRPNALDASAHGVSIQRLKPAYSGPTGIALIMYIMSTSPSSPAPATGMRGPSSPAVEHRRAILIHHRMIAAPADRYLAIFEPWLEVWIAP